MNVEMSISFFIIICTYNNYYKILNSNTLHSLLKMKKNLRIDIDDDEEKKVMVSP